jgi:hypothetical protein
MYKDRIKYKGALPHIPGARRLAAALAPHRAVLAAAAPLAADRPVHVISVEEAAAARRFLQVRGLGAQAALGPSERLRKQVHPKPCPAPSPYQPHSPTNPHTHTHTLPKRSCSST